MEVALNACPDDETCPPNSPESRRLNAVHKYATNLQVLKTSASESSRARMLIRDQNTEHLVTLEQNLKQLQEAHDGVVATLAGSTLLADREQASKDVEDAQKDYDETNAEFNALKEELSANTRKVRFCFCFI